MDDYYDLDTYLDFLNGIDDNELLQGDFPSFSTVPEQGEGINNVDSNPINIAETPPSSNTASTTPDESRFPVVSQEYIDELQSAAANKNTKRATKQWINVLKSWCTSRHLVVDIVTMSTQDLDNLLCQFYAEVKKKNGDDYEPDTLRQMQSSIDRHLKESGRNVSIVRAREFSKSQNILNAKAMSLRRDGKGRRPNKAQPLEPEEEDALWQKGQLGDFNGRTLTNINFKNLTEQLGLRGRQEHHDAYVEDFAVEKRQDGSEIVKFQEGLTKTRSGGLRMTHRKTPQTMFSTDGGDKDPVRLFKLWLSKRPQGMKNNGPLYLSIINRPKSSDVWYSKIRMGENTIGSIMKSMTSCLNTTKKLTNHSMRKTVVAKLKRSGQPRNVICEITGHARESSLDDYDEIDENQKKDLSHIISGYKDGAKNMQLATTNQPSNPQIPANTALERPPLAPVYQHQNSQSSHMMSLNSFAAGFPMQTWHQSMLASSSSAPTSTFSSCTFNYHMGPSTSTSTTTSPQPKKQRRRAYIIESDDEE